MFERVQDAWNVLRGLQKVTKQPQSGARGVRYGSPADAPDEDISVLSASYQFYKNWTHMEPDRLAVYSDMDEMLTYVLASSALDAYVEDACQPDFSTGLTVTPSSPNAQVAAELHKFFENIELEDRIAGDIWNLAKYGDYFSLLLVDQDKGVFDACPLEPRIVWRHEDSRRVLQGFSIGDASENTDDSQKKVPNYKPWDIVHWRCRSKRVSDPYGIPFFFGVRMIYKVLKLMEEQMVIYRMNMHPDRLVFKVFTGNSGPEDRRRQIRMWRREMERFTSMDKSTGSFRSEYAPWMVNQNIYWPVAQGDQNSGVEKFPGCFTGDTKISLLSGEEVSLQDLTDRDEFWVYSFDAEGNFYPGRGHSARLTKRNAPVVKVTLDTGETIRCTPDHLFMLRDGSYKQAEYLTPDDSLMPLYRKTDGHGYEMLASNRRYQKTRPLRCSSCGEDGHNKRTCGRAPSPNWVHTHRLVSLEFEGSSIQDGHVIHHGDFNRRNNTPDNLVRMSEDAHVALHTEHLEYSIHTPEAKQKAAEARRRRYADPDWRSRKRVQQRRTISELWENEDFSDKAMRNLNLQTPEELSSNAQKANHERWHVRRGKKSDSCALCTQNHRVVSVEPDGCADVYDITVDAYHNFSLSAGVVVHNSNNAGDIFDVNYMRDLFFAGVRVPKAYMGFEDSQGYRGTDTLSSQSIKFARGVKKLQRYYLRGLTRLCMIHLACKGIDAREPANQFTLEMSPTSYLDEAHKAELYAKRYEALNYMLDIGSKMRAELGINSQVWTQYILKEFGGWDDNMISQLTAPESPQGPDMNFTPDDTALSFESEEQKIRSMIGNDKALAETAAQIRKADAAFVRDNSLNMKGNLQDILPEKGTTTDRELFDEAKKTNRDFTAAQRKKEDKKRAEREVELKKIAENWQEEGK